MPELAEVETVRKRIIQQLRQEKIKEVIVDESDRFLFAFATPEAVKKSLIGATVKGAGRKGKYFWIELDRKPWPLFHLGMSGNLTFLNPRAKNFNHERTWGGAKLWKEKDEDLKKKLWFSRILIRTKNGVEMSLLDPRRFGRMWLTNDPWTHSRIKKLGYDPLLDFPSMAVLQQRLQKRKKSIKSVLLDQTLFAGIGNWLADEILYQARLSPHHLASRLTTAQIKNLRLQILKVVKKAVKVEADYEQFPKAWIFHHRWGKAKGAKTSRGKILHEEIGGRTTAWVPDWQK